MVRLQSRSNPLDLFDVKESDRRKTWTETAFRCHLLIKHPNDDTTKIFPSIIIVVVVVLFVEASLYCGG